MNPTIAIIEDNIPLANTLKKLLATVALNSKIFHSVEEFLSTSTSMSECIISDVRLPGISGLQLQHKLHALPNHPPIILISGTSTIRTAVQAIKNGAVHFLAKPIDNQELIDTIFHILAQQKLNKETQNKKDKFMKKIKTLTHRELEITRLISDANSSEQIATSLFISRNTVEVHRSNIMRKTGLTSAELIALSHKYELHNYMPHCH